MVADPSARAAELPEPPVLAAPATSFDIERDGFAFSNGLRWDYGSGETGFASKSPGPDEEYDHRCSQMARAARQFFYSARFAPDAPRATQAEYREIVAEVVKSDPRRTAPDETPISVPGYLGLAEFSSAHEPILKQALGGSWRTYRQRGNWRMVFTFSPGQRRKAAESLLASLEAGHPPIVHVMRFPHITINHTLLLYRAEATTTEIRFEAYDPNGTGEPVPLRYDRARAEFELVATSYWKGGSVDVYEVYHGLLY